MRINEIKVDASCIPLGFMMAAEEYKNPNPRIRGTVLEQIVRFDPLLYADARRAFLDVWVMGGPRMPMLLIGLQIEDARLSWLADPAESAIWEAMDDWNLNGSVSIALSQEGSHSGAHMFTIPLQSRIDESVNLLRRLKARPVSDVFTLQAIEVFDGGLLDAFDIPGLSEPVFRSACLLHTAGVHRALQHRGYEAQYDGMTGSFCARKVGKSGAKGRKGTKVTGIVRV